VEMVRPHCFDAVFLCFDVQDRLSMRNIVTWVCCARKMLATLSPRRGELGGAPLRYTG